MEKICYEKRIAGYHMDIVEHTFSSLYEYVEYLKNGKTTSLFMQKQSSLATDDIEWYGTKNMKEAMKFCTDGEYDEKFDAFDRERIRLEEDIATKKRKIKIKNDIVGFMPNVPAYLIGIPKNMYNISRERKPAPKVIDIYYNISCLGGNSAEQMQNRGISTLALIKDLESQGYMVQLHLFAASSCGDQLIFTKWDLKNAGEAIDYRSLYFPMVNPSFLRRLHFRLREITPELTDCDWPDGYGHTCNTDEVRDLLGLEKGKGIVINQPSDCNIRGESIIKDYDNFCHALKDQIQSAKDRPLENEEEREM